MATVEDLIHAADADMYRRKAERLKKQATPG
jgi:hypothetical protein